MDRLPPGFAVVDVETTGLRSKGDRVIEVAVVRLDANGSVIAEFSTLVNPERNPGASHIHGLSAEDLETAPIFARVMGELIQYLDGAVLVGHNVMFDVSFLKEEFQRAGLSVPMFPFLCTRDLAQVVLPKLGEYRLAACCRAFGIAQGPEHQALEDARATATLFTELWRHDEARRNYPRDLRYAHSVVWPEVHERANIYTRAEAQRKRQAEQSRLADIVAHLPDGNSGGNVERYLDLLDEILEDRYVTDDAANLARKFINAEGLLRADVLEAHRTYLIHVAHAAIVADLGKGLGSADVESVARSLGLSANDQAHAFSEAQARKDQPLRPLRKPLRTGMTVCFTGDPVPAKDELGRRATAAGLVVKDSVTKKLDLLVVDQPRSMSAKAQKARAQGTRMMAVPAFLSSLKRMV